VINSSEMFLQSESAHISLELITAHRFPDQYAGDRGTPAAEEGTSRTWYLRMRSCSSGGRFENEAPVSLSDCTLACIVAVRVRETAVLGTACTHAAD
jgi:hypothetical protein